ncbi:hypothetical protein [Gloeocapsopsis dulcis]|uniref:hypothetical protein n=1 Tax=Gloeocapsopsis dulcis TaxID=2859516 RepID=UPI00101AD076|nr:hypothetical protein [Gloeocapsopsis dulcis]WNN90310.1 hypothetical protein P0S91_04220 [Gloeocapsopsis dulcis]
MDISASQANKFVTINILIDVFTVITAATTWEAQRRCFSGVYIQIKNWFLNCPCIERASIGSGVQS